MMYKGAQTSLLRRAQNIYIQNFTYTQFVPASNTFFKLKKMLNQDQDIVQLLNPILTVMLSVEYMQVHLSEKD